MILNGNVLAHIKKKIIGFDYDKKHKFVIINRNQFFVMKYKLNQIGFNLKYVGSHNHIYVEKLTEKEIKLWEQL